MIKMSIRIDHLKNTVRTAVITAILISLAFHCYAQNVSDLEKFLPQATGKEKVDTLNQLCSLLYIDEPQRAITYGTQALNLAKNIAYLQGEALALYFLSEGYSNAGENNKPIQLCREALRLFEKSQDDKGILDSHTAMANYYRRNDNYEEALKHSIQALRVSEKLADNEARAESLYTIGNIYLRLPDYEKALEYLKNAVAIEKQTEKKERIAHYLNSVGLAYNALGQYGRALENYNDALNRYTQQDNTYGVGHALLNIGMTYKNMGEYQQAFKYLQNSLKKYQEKNYKSGICRVFTHIGESYFKLNQNEKAIAYYRDALNVAKKSNDTFMIKYIHEKLSELYKASGDYKNALEHYIIFTNIKDSLLNEKKNKQIAQMQEQYESDKKAKEIEILKKTNKIKTMTRNFLIAGLIMTLILLTVIFKKYIFFFSFWKKQKYIGQYRLLATIGSGGMGNIYKAHNIRDKSSIVAIKVLREELSKSESERIRFKREGAIIDKLAHPNILKIYERGVIENKLYFVMEYIEGITLEKKIEDEGQLEIGECLDIMIQVTDALALIHGSDILHRDLKPANIMLTEKDGNPNFVKLLDFGLSRMKYQTRITESGLLIGTINYLPPEHITGYECSPASDIYSLGIIFYEMVVGSIAFTGDSMSAIVGKIIDNPPPEPKSVRPGIPGELNRLIVKMISKQDTQRPSTQTVLNTLKNITI